MLYSGFITTDVGYLMDYIDRIRVARIHTVTACNCFQVFTWTKETWSSNISELTVNEALELKKHAVQNLI